MNNEEIKFNIPLLKISYAIVNFLQKLTISYLLKLLIDKKGYNSFFKSIVTSINFSWLFFSIIILIFDLLSNNFIIYFIVYRLWEMLIINFWMFIFRQGATRVEDTTFNENDTRLFILLIIQYFTIVLLYASLYHIINHNNLNSFFFGEHHNSNEIINWIYYSVATISTVGYGDIYPVSTLAKLSVISQIFIGLFYVMMFISNILSRLKFKWN